MNLESYKVLIVGDIMLDRYLYGNVSRISPEAPVPILEKVKMENKPGGAANVALNIKSLGSQPILLSVVGDDENGSVLVNSLERNKIFTNYILKERSRATTVKTRIMSGGQHLMRIDEENTSIMSSESISKLKESFLTILDLEDVDAVIFQDYDKGLLNDDLIEFFITKAKEIGLFISVDPKFNNFFSYKNVDFFKPNLKEVGSAVNKTITPEMGNLDEVCEELNSKLDFKHLFITLGDKGIYYSNIKESDIVATELRDVVDVSGAGDVVLCASTLFLLSGKSPFEVAQISNVAGGLACKKVGVATVNKYQLINEIKKKI